MTTRACAKSNIMVNIWTNENEVLKPLKQRPLTAKINMNNFKTLACFNGVNLILLLIRTYHYQLKN